MQLRPYQHELQTEIFNAWNRGARNVLAVLPTGAGKTVLFSKIIHSHKGAVCAIAHRQELVSQISLALARDGVRHRIIGPKHVIKLCVNIQMGDLGQSYYDPSAVVAVAGVDTLVRRSDPRWEKTVTLWVQDEAHHLLRGNKWGTAVAKFPNARGLGVTATPLRTDGQGLGSHADGVFNKMVVGPGMRDLINAGYLTDYRIFAPPSDLDLSDVKISSTTGEYSRQGLHIAVQKSRIVGDVVSHYKRIAGGLLGVTFATDVETATTIAHQFNEAGVPAAVVSAKTSDADRVAVIKKFKRRELMQLVNVDVFGEGFDLPAISVVSMARPTQSEGLQKQQFGRGLRLMEGKTHAIIIDHVGNIARHGLPDAPRVWSLDRRERRTRGAQPDVIPVRTCMECFSVYERIYPVCPFCGVRPVLAARSKPEFVDGDLCELDAAALAVLRGEVAVVDQDAETYRAVLAARHAPLVAQLTHVKRHVERQEAQRGLRDAIAWWAGLQRSLGRSDSESYRRFFHGFGVDVLTAQTLKPAEAESLTARVKLELKGLVPA